jgi:hypothetical protein
MPMRRRHRHVTGLLAGLVCSAAAAGAASVTPAALQAQTATPVVNPDPFPPESQRDPNRYSVGGRRDGRSTFLRVRHPEVEYEAGDRLTFDKYHTVDVMYTWMKRWAERHPNIVEIYEIGRSFEGRPILQMTLTNKSTGAATDKPAAYFEGGRHSGEITSSESVLWLMQHLIESYGRNREITRLLDTKAIYLRPQNNPDGSNLYLHTAQANRSSVRPVDQDGDGFFDEDPNNDIDGDGVIYQMRWRPANPAEATHVLDERDPSGRLMRPARAGETAIWRTMSECTDDDGDGRWCEDGIGGLDLHRNYPMNWRPMPGGDATGRGWTQGGAGEFPLSEPETRSVVLWLLANPNISVVNSMDTRVPMHLRPPSTSRDFERMYPEDLRYYEYFDSLGLTITNYPWAGDVYWTYATRNVPDEMLEETRGSPLFGHGPDFGYWYYGSIWYGDELWSGGMHIDMDNDGRRDQYDALLWDDQHNGGRGFKPWTRATHPVFGEIEIGGFHPKFFSQNGPPEVLEEWSRNQALFNLQMALHLPELEMLDPQVRRIAQDGDSATYEITVRWRNNGRLPTALKQAQLVKIVQEDRAFVRLPAALTRGERPQVRLIEPSRGGGAFLAGWTEPGETKTATFNVRTYGVPGARFNVEVLSTRGGVLRREVTVGTPR